MKLKAKIFIEIGFGLQSYDLREFESTIELLNARIDNMPFEASVQRLVPDTVIDECTDPFTCNQVRLDPEVGYLSDLCKNCQERVEDEDYARQCEYEKWRTPHAERQI